MEEIELLLLNLHRRYLDIAPRFGGFLGIYLIAAFLRQEGYNAKGFSGSLHEGKKHLDKICTGGRLSAVGLYCDYENVTETIFLSRYIKEHYHLHVIVGGPQATALKASFLFESRCDVLVRYEGELTVLELMNYFLEGVGDLGYIRGIAYLDSKGAIRINPERELIRNLDALPFIDEQCYLEPRQYYQSLSLMTGRGCPFHCAFCHEGAHTREVRFRSVENVLAELEAYLSRWYKEEEAYILFTDDTLTLDSERVRRLCEGIVEIRKKTPFRWFCEGHVHTLSQHPEMIGYLAAAGCTRVQLGIEGGTASVLHAYGKRTTPEEIIEVVRKCRDAGIGQVYGNIILAGAHFSEEIYEKDKEFALRLLEEGHGVVELGVVTFWPLPETPMTLCPDKYGIQIMDREFVTSAGDFPQAQTKEIDRFRVSEMQRELESVIFAKMIQMLENWEVPTERVLQWFSNARDKRSYGGWIVQLGQHEILFPYYEMLYLAEGVASGQVENMASAHPLRIAPLYKYLHRTDENTVEILGETFAGSEINIVLLTAGKLSVREIAVRTGETMQRVVSVLDRLEKKHFIVYACQENE